MPLNRIECPSCGAGLKSTAGFAVGQKVRCPKCQMPFAVEEPADADDDVAPPPKPAARPSAAPAKKPVRAVAAAVDDEDDEDDRPRKKKRPARDDDDDDRPRKKKKKKGGYKTSPVRFVILGVLLVVLGVLGYMLYDKKQKEKADAAKPAPAETDPDAELAKPIKIDGKGKSTTPTKNSSSARPPVPLPTPVPSTAAANQTELQYLASALHTYAAEVGRLPAPAIRAKDGTPLLSWRVAILPYIKQDALYAAFRRDEPWDGPTNKPLLARMPRTFETPGAPPGTTAVKAVVGDGSPFAPGRRLGFDQITDGPANTLLLVEAGAPVAWTKPDDIRFDPAGPAPDFRPPGGGDRTTVVMCDGSVRRLRLKGRPDAEVRALVTAAGGEPPPRLE